MGRHNLLHVPGRIEVVESGFVLATDVGWARSWRERSRGLLGGRLERGQALIIEPAKQVHSFGMSYPIDVLFCDRNWTVVHVVRDMAPRRLTKIVPRARYAIELLGESIPRDVTVGSALRVTAGSDE